jgi:pimeloyl-ACP methyl ester carboxylesterase
MVRARPGEGLTPVVLAPARGAPATAGTNGVAGREGLRPRRWPLAVAAALLMTLELVGVVPAWAGLHHLVALPPLDLAADARALVSLAPSLPAFAAGLAVALVVRTVLLAALLGGLDRPRLRLAGTLQVAALVPVLLAALLAWSAEGLLYAAFLQAGVAVTALLAVVLAAAPWTGASTLREGLRRSWDGGLRIGVLLGYATALVALGPLAADGGPAGRLLAVAGSALLTGVAITLLARPPRLGRGAVLAAAAALAVVAALVVRTADAPPAPRPPERPGTLVLLSGISSASGDGAMLEIDPRDLGYPCERTHHASYAGPGDGQPRGDAACPIPHGAPYDELDTLRPFDEQVEALRAQLDGLEPPIVIAGHSQGAWVAWAAAAQGVEGLSALVLVGTLPDNVVGAPAAGERGAGTVGRFGFRHLLQPLAGLADQVIDVDAPFPREMLLAPGSAEDVFMRPLPAGVAVLSVPATVDLPLLPRGPRLAGARNACPVRSNHADLPQATALHRAINTFLDGEPPPTCPLRQLLRPLGVPFGVPPHSDVTAPRPRPPVGALVRAAEGAALSS